jgi:hypothetical protein
LPSFLFDYFWPAAAVWSLLYISDYALTMICARLYRAQDTIVFEGSYELNPLFQRDVDSLRVVSPRFVFTLLLILGLLAFLWRLNEQSPAPELWQFVLGCLIIVQLAVHMRHVRNLFLFRSIKNTDLIRGRIAYARTLAFRISSVEWFAFSGLFLILFAFTQSWFILGGATACFFLGANRRRLARRSTTKVAGATQSPEET